MLSSYILSFNQSIINITSFRLGCNVKKKETIDYKAEILSLLAVYSMEHGENWQLRNIETY